MPTLASRGAAWLLATVLGLAACSSDVVERSVVADASGLDWELILSHPPESDPGVAEVFTGTGDDDVDLDQPLPIMVVQAHHTGSGDFMVRAIRDDGTTADAIDVTGRYTGELLAYEGVKETVGFEVRADGPWALLAKSLVTAPDGQELARQYEGAGDAVVAFPMDFDDPTPVTAFARANLRHDGEADFVVRQMFGDVVVDEVGRYNDSVRLPATGLFGLEITADGPWTVTFE